MKKFIISTLCVILCISIFVSAQGDTIIEAMLYDVDIFFNGKKVEFNAPVVIINNQTYIPLREAAENSNIEVEWNGETREIMLTENSFEINNIFTSLFGFSLPKSAKITNYDYYIEYEDQNLVAKITFDEGDLEYIKDGLGKNLAMHVDSMSKITDNPPFISYYSNKYSWWDVTTLDEIQYCYHGVTGSISYWSIINIWGFIIKDSDNQFCLYVSHGYIG